MQLFTSLIRQPDRSLANLPNGNMQKDGILNYTHLGISHVDLAFTLKYEADVEKAREIIMDIMTGDERVLAEPPPAVVVINMGEYGSETQAQLFVWKETNNYAWTKKPEGLRLEVENNGQ